VLKFEVVSTRGILVDESVNDIKVPSTILPNREHWDGSWREKHI
jgi:hypothetical protein